MPQTTGSVPQANFFCEISLNGSTWTDISGTASNVTVDGGDQMTGQQYTADGDIPVIAGANKTEPLTITVSAVYTEVVGESWTIVHDKYISVDKRIYFRYSPRGNVSTNKRYVCANAANTAIPVPIINCTPPDVDASTGDPALFEFSLLAPKLAKEAIP